MKEDIEYANHIVFRKIFIELSSNIKTRVYRCISN